MWQRLQQWKVPTATCCHCPWAISHIHLSLVSENTHILQMLIFWTFFNFLQYYGHHQSFMRSYARCATGLNPNPFHSSHSIETYCVTVYVLILLGYFILIYHISVNSSWPLGLEKWEETTTITTTQTWKKSWCEYGNWTLSNIVPLILSTMGVTPKSYITPWNCSIFALVYVL